MLADGEYLITGGSSATEATIYSPETGAFSSADDMVVPRGYHASATLGNGDVFTVGGSWSGGRGNKFGEYYSARDQQWNGLPNVPAEFLSTLDVRGIFSADNHMWLFTAPDGNIFHAGPAVDTNYISVDGAGSIERAGARGSFDAMNGTAAMYDIGKIFVAGGAVNYSNSPGRSDTWTIDINGGVDNTVIRQGRDMAYARTLHSSVILPSGEIMVAGGQAVARQFTDDQAILVPEIWNPTTGRFSQHPPMEIPRTYHSSAILLKDGRVWIGGGGLCFFRRECPENHPDAEIFTPPYLLNPDGSPKERPEIQSAPNSATYGDRIEVQADTNINDFVLMRLGSATHAINTDQRRVPVEFEQNGVSGYSVNIPANSNVLIPGNYYLFAISSEGVPSEAVTINIQ